MYRQTIWSTIAVAVLLSGCATTSEYAQRADNLENELASMKSNSEIEQYAAVAVNEAEESLQKARDLIDENADDELISHQLYLAERKIDIAEEVAVMNKSQQIVADAELREKEMLLGIRTEEAQSAQAAAEAMRLEAAQMSSRASELEKEIEDLKTKETDRGLVLVPGNILFEFDSANIKPGSERTIQKVAQFLIEYPDRQIQVEGFTDSVGDETYNQELSRRRAEAVKQALINAGVPSNRINAEGMGEEFPVASNETPSGRLENRRVEIIVATNGESVAQRGQRQ